MQKRLFCATFGVLLLISCTTLVCAQEHDPFLKEFAKKTEKKKPRSSLKPAKETPALQIEHAGDLVVQGKIRKAMRAYRALVHTWHDAPEAVTAQRAYARLLEEEGRYDLAFKELQYLIENYAGSFQYRKALEAQFRIAQHIMTRKSGGFLFISGFSSPERALPLFEQIVRNAPNWERTPEAQFMIGVIYEEMDETEMAVNAYEATRNRYPRSDFASEAAFRRCFCLYSVATDAPRDEFRNSAAIASLRAFVADYPDSLNAGDANKYLAELQARVEEIFLNRAKFYDRSGRSPAAAVIAYEDFVKRFPNSELARDARERIRELNREIQRKDRS